jgi:hypothetical protein
MTSATPARPVGEREIRAFEAIVGAARDYAFGIDIENDDDAFDRAAEVCVNDLGLPTDRVMALVEAAYDRAYATDPTPR